MHGKFFNVPLPSAGTHTFILKWYMTRVPYEKSLQDYPPTVNIPPSNYNKFSLQTAINHAITVEYKIFPQQSSTSNYNYSWQRI